MNKLSRLQALLRMFVVLSLFLLGAFTTGNAWASNISQNPNGSPTLTDAQNLACNVPAGKGKANFVCPMTGSSHFSSKGGSSHSSSSKVFTKTTSNKVVLPLPTIKKFNLSSNKGSKTNLSTNNLKLTLSKNKGNVTDPPSNSKGSTKLTVTKGNDPPTKLTSNKDPSSGESSESASLMDKEKDLGHEVSSSSESGESTGETGESDRVQDRENSSGEEVSSEKASESESTENEENESSDEESAENNSTTTTTVITSPAISITTLAGTVSNVDENTDTLTIGNVTVSLPETAENGMELQNGDTVTFDGFFVNSTTFDATATVNENGPTTPDNGS